MKSAHDFKPKPLKIGFLLCRDFTLSAFSMFVDTLRLASDVGDRSGRVHCDWEVVSANGQLVKSSAGVDVAPTSPFGDPHRFTHVAVVGGLLLHQPPLDEASIGFLRKSAAAGVPLIGVCTGSFVLARSGLMTGRKICVSWYHIDDFRQQFPETSVFADRLFFVDGNRITCAGGAGAADLAAYLVERHLGLQLKDKALQILQVERARSPSDPQPRSPLGLEITDDRVRRALLLMEQELSEPIPIAQIARRVGLSTRGLERLFVDKTGITPTAAYGRLRLSAAYWLVCNTKRSMIDICVSTGFCTPANFTTRFKEAFGSPPTLIRQTGRGARSNIGEQLWQKDAAGLRSAIQSIEASRLLDTSVERNINSTTDNPYIESK